MLPYLLLLFISAILPLFIYQPRGLRINRDYSVIIKKRNTLTISVFFVGLFILLTLRDLSVGKDLYTYKSIFESCATTPFKELSNMQWELGYTFYNKIFSLISSNYRAFLVITSILILLPVYFLFIKEKRYCFLLIVLYINMPCFLMVFSGLRQAIAISIGILVYFAIEKKKIVLSVLLIVLASSFHISALILCILYPIYFIRIKVKHLLFITPIMLLIYIFRIPILTLMINLMPSHYIEFYGEVQQTGAIGMLILFLIFLVFSFVVLDEEIMSKRDYFMRNVLLVATMFQFFVPIHGLIQRASYYFLVFVPISILCVVQAPKRRLKNISNVAVIVMGCFFFLYFFYNAIFSTDNLLDVFPYKFFWGGQGW